ncbi:MAG TPA: YfiR family protein [Polyangiaceae bacterium]|nr:YfiR family protein [Polyangiaceae bacterium]
MVRHRWSILLSATLAAAAVFGEHWGRAELLAVPIELQAELLAKVAAYDRNMSSRAGARVQVLLVTNAADAESARFATRMQLALQSISQIGGLPHEERIAPFTSAADLAQQCRARHLAIIIVGPGLGDRIIDIRDALDGVDVLTVASVPDYVQQGVVLGFDVVSGKPKLLVHLPRARRQNVDLRAEVLKLMRVLE